MIFFRTLAERCVRIGTTLLDVFLVGYNRASYHNLQRDGTSRASSWPTTAATTMRACCCRLPHFSMHRVHPWRRGLFLQQPVAGRIFRIFMNVLPIERSAKMIKRSVIRKPPTKGHSIILRGTRTDGQMDDLVGGISGGEMKLPVIPPTSTGACGHGRAQPAEGA